MKHKYHILKEAPKVSDNELAEMMDFDALMESGKTLSRFQIRKLLKPWIIGTTLTVMIAAGIAVWLWQSDTSNSEIKEHIIDQSTKENSSEEGGLQLTPEPTKPQDVDVIKKSAAPVLSQEKEPDQVARESVEKTKAPKNDESIIPQAEPSGDAVKEFRSAVEKDEYVFIDATPVDGTEALYKYIRENLEYPEGENDKTIEGEVIVSFTITKEGEVKDIKTEKSLGSLFDQEAIKVILGMPAWKAASLNGNNVDSRLSIPLYFNRDNSTGQ